MQRLDIRMIAGGPTPARALTRGGTAYHVCDSEDAKLSTLGASMRLCAFEVIISLCP